MAFPVPIGRIKRADPLNVAREPGAAFRHEAHPSHIRELVPQPAALRITDADRIRSIFATLSAEQAMGVVRVVHADNEGTDKLASPDVVKLALGPKLFVSGEFRDVACQQPWLVELQGPYSLVRFRLEPDARLGGGRFLLPAELECVYRRSERRVSTPPSAKIRILRTQAPETWLERPLRDVGFRGLQFVTSPDDVFYPGERFCAAEVTWKHGPCIPLITEVRHVSVGELPNDGLCGVSVNPGTGALAEMWQQEISSLLHPNTALAALTASEQLWDLYDVSGYFQLGGHNARDFEHLKRAFTVANAKLARAPDIACRVVREHRARLEATITLLRPWSGAWLDCQVARRQESNPLALSGNAVLRDMFLHAHETVQQHPSLKWHVTYVRKDARFSRLAYYDFAARRNDGRQVAVVPFRAMQVSCNQPLIVSLDHIVDVGSAHPDEIVAVLASLAANFPNPYLEAYDFVQERFDVRAIRNAWFKARLARERDVLVARHHGVPAAAAILDLVEPGTHLVGLLDSVHLVSLQTDGDCYYPALLLAAQQFYRSRNRKNFVLFEETGDPTLALSLGIRDMGEANQIFVTAALTPEFLEHISFITAPRSHGETQ